MRKAFCMIRAEPWYRRDAFMAGLAAAGYATRFGGPSEGRPGDVLLMWNRYAEWHQVATQFEARGGTVLVAENGYVGPGGVSPHAMEPRSVYALAIGGHNGSGRWNVGGPERWDALGVELKPWRVSGEYILVCPNRSFGRPDLIMPLGWERDVAARLAKVTKRPVRIRPHPGNGQPKVPLAHDLENAAAMVIWSSSAGVQALIAGIPVFCDAPHWICKGAADQAGALNASPQDRLSALRALAWAQWSVEEIASGEPFCYLLSDTRQGESAAAV